MKNKEIKRFITTDISIIDNDNEIYIIPASSLVTLISSKLDSKSPTGVIVKIKYKNNTIDIDSDFLRENIINK